MKKTSKKNSLDHIDRQKWLNNTVVFLAPAMLVFLTAVQSGVPVEQALLAVYTWGLNAMIDLTKKFLSDNVAD